MPKTRLYDDSKTHVADMDVSVDEEKGEVRILVTKCGGKPLGYMLGSSALIFKYK